MKSDLSVFSKAPYGKRYIFKRIMWFFRSLSCAWQRATKGYCYRDLWSLDSFYTKIFYNSLWKFVKHLHGAPQEFFNQETNTIEAWERYIEEMAKHFYNSLEDNEVEESYNEFEEEYHKLNPLILEKVDGGYRTKETTDPRAIEVKGRFFRREEEIEEWREEELQKGFNMLQEVFHNLWD